MKKIFLITLVTCALKIYSQDCNHFFFLQNNKSIEMTAYGSRDEVTGKSVYTVSNLTNSGGVAKATLTSEAFDGQGTSISKNTGWIRCEGGLMKLDMLLMVPPQQQKDPFGNAMQIKADTVYLEYPTSMNPGDALKDVHFTMTVTHPGGPGAPPPPPGPFPGPGSGQKVTMNITERKVQSKESVTTPAGTWDCFKITYKSKVSAKSGPFGFPVTTDVTEWYAPGFGVVKRQSKNGITQITAIK